MASPLPPLPVLSGQVAEAGFTLIEVLAALTIASLTILMAMQLFTLSARVTDRMIKQTAAQDLARRLLATAETGSGKAGALNWEVEVSLPKDGLIVRQLSVRWASGAEIAVAQLEPAPEAVR